MSLDDRILDSLRVFGRSTAKEIAARTGIHLLEVDRRLGSMCGTHVACTRGVWRLLNLPADAALSNMAMSACQVLKAYTAQAGR